MPAIASLEQLKAVNQSIESLKEKYPEAFKEMVETIKKYRKIGYKNICKMMLGEATPEKLKEE